MKDQEIIDLLNIPISDNERDMHNMLCGISSHSYAMANYLVRKTDMGSIVGRIKPNGKEFGYIPANSSAGYLYLIMKRLGINNLMDLGCGMGIILSAIDIGQIMSGNKEHMIYGYDNESSLLEVAKEIHRYTSHKFLCKDICSLNHEDILERSIIYWYAPFTDKELIKKFIFNINRVTYKGQIFAIIGYGEHMVNQGMRCINSFQGLDIYIK